MIIGVPEIFSSSEPDDSACNARPVIRKRSVVFRCLCSFPKWRSAGGMRCTEFAHLSRYIIGAKTLLLVEMSKWRRTGFVINHNPQARTESFCHFTHFRILNAESFDDRIHYWRSSFPLVGPENKHISPHTRCYLLAHFREKLRCLFG